MSSADAISVYIVWLIGRANAPPFENVFTAKYVSAGIHNTCVKSAPVVMRPVVLQSMRPVPTIILNSLVGRCVECSSRGVWQGVKVQEYVNISSFYNAVQTPGELCYTDRSAFTQKVKALIATNLELLKRLMRLRSGQLMNLGLSSRRDRR